ncbi:hypothetical protein IGI04_026111 [Brassica rapa subsp. trilocularis]|uniref:DUF7781 domain-containing protein n=1 Tax=Brassica rapa subsp. trilocularis TaxID=1813537 RepID=A0ABQ7KY53_BRACM|nr:hypothetical protein IGI04_026111 [Brassica rapa subsp. trilocularis]
MSTERRPMTNEENAMFLDILQEAPLFGHRKSRSLVGSYLYLILLAGYAVLAAGAPWIFHHLHHLTPSLLCCCDVALLILTGIFQQYFVFQVQKIRLQGYYSFSQKLKHVVRLPFAIASYGICPTMSVSLDFTGYERTAAMLLVIVWDPQISILSTSSLQRIIMIAESVCAGFFMSLYIGYVHQYNSVNSRPDVLKSLYSPLQPSSSMDGLRYYEGRLSDQQTALLQYQRENLHFLSEEILSLQEKLSKYEQSDDGSTPQVDLAHLLASRDQELRTLSAEMNQLQTELRLARSLIAERDAEVQRVNNTNSQYIEENERLRAILSEWSMRAANLERALEVERMSNSELQKEVAGGRRKQQMVETSEQPPLVVCFGSMEPPPSSRAEEPPSWDELYKINLMPSELFLKFRKELQGLRVGVNLELYNEPTNDYHAKLVLKPLSPERKWKFIYEPLHQEVRVLSKKIPLTRFLNLQVGVGHNFQMNAMGWKWKLTSCLGGDGVSRIRNKTTLGLTPGVDLRFGWRADFVLPEVTGALGTEEPFFNMSSGRLEASLDRVEAILTHSEYL